MNSIKQNNHFQLAVIGAGSGGLVAAEFAAKMGARVVLIEAEPVLGGECLRSGCVPSKALIHSARLFWQSGHGQSFGVTGQPVLDFAHVTKHINDSISFIEHNHDNDGYFEQKGITVVHGKAEFVSPSVVKVGNELISFKRAIISTGSSPAIPDIPGLDSVPYLTNESIFSLRSLPRSLTIIGGGPIGCELGQAYAMLGARVTILQSNTRLMPRDEPEASELILKSFSEMGIRVVLSSDISGVSQTGRLTNVTVNGEVVSSEQLLVAVGRRPNVPIGLAEIGVLVNARGIEVDNTMRTSRSRIFAVGDCIGGVQFTHVAAQQAGVAISNALFGLKRTVDSTMVPWVTFTTPEVAHFGTTKQALLDAGTTHKASRIGFSDIDKAVTENEPGYVEILTGRGGKILGATVVGVHAAELLGQIVQLQGLGVPLRQVASVMQAYPTFSIGLKQLSAGVMMTKLTSGFTGRIIAFMIRLRIGA